MVISPRIPFRSSRSTHLAFTIPHDSIAFLVVLKCSRKCQTQLRTNSVPLTEMSRRDDDKKNVLPAHYLLMISHNNIICTYFIRLEFDLNRLWLVEDLPTYSIHPLSTIEVACISAKCNCREFISLFSPCLLRDRNSFVRRYFHNFLNYLSPGTA